MAYTFQNDIVLFFRTSSQVLVVHFPSTDFNRFPSFFFDDIQHLVFLIIWRTSTPFVQQNIFTAFSVLSFSHFLSPYNVKTHQILIGLFFVILFILFLFSFMQTIRFWNLFSLVLSTAVTFLNKNRHYVLLIYLSTTYIYRFSFAIFILMFPRLFKVYYWTIVRRYV